MNVEQPVSNLYIKGYGLDKNGNFRILVGFPNDKGFSIQTNGNLPETDYILRGRGKKPLNSKELKTIGTEITDYVSKYGNSNQKSKLKMARSESNFLKLKRFIKEEIEKLK